MSLAQLGKRHTPEARANMSASRIGKKHTAQWVKNIAAGFAKAMAARKFNKTMNLINPSYSVSDKKCDAGFSIRFGRQTSGFEIGRPNMLLAFNN